jgi:hypothetical protein
VILRLLLRPSCRREQRRSLACRQEPASPERAAATDPAAQRLGLHESRMMGIARLPSADEARLRRHELQMGTIAVALFSVRAGPREG